MDKGFKKLEKYFEKAKSNHIAFEGYCHDCKKLTIVTVDLEDNGKLKVDGGAVYFPDIISEEKTPSFFVKCDSCYTDDSTLRNYQPCLVYSRTVGYLRPVSSWNEGKRSEFKYRKEYRLPKEKVLTI